MEWQKYEKKGITEMTPVTDSLQFDSSFPWPSVSISEADKKNGSPKTGDMIARNPENHNDMWLVAKEYFEENYQKQAVSEIGGFPLVDLIINEAKRVCTREIEMQEEGHFADEHEYLLELIESYEAQQVDIIHDVCGKKIKECDCENPEVSIVD